MISQYLSMEKELETLRQEEQSVETASVNEAIDYEQVAQRKTRIAQLENGCPPARQRPARSR